MSTILIFVIAQMLGHTEIDPQILQLKKPLIFHQPIQNISVLINPVIDYLS